MVKVAELYVSNLPYDANADNLRAAFERAGPVRDVRLPLHRINGTCRGFAFVLMESEAIVDSVAEKMDNSTFRGRKIGVKAQRSTTNESHMELNKLLTAAASAGDVLQLFARRGADFNHVNLATCLHRLGALRGTIGDEPKAVEIMQKLLCKVESNLHAHAPDWVPRALANATWGLARVGCECDSLFESIAALSLATLESFIAQNLANTVWAFATAGFPAKELFEAVWQACVEKIATFNAQDLCNVAWAFSKAGFEAPKLFEAVSKEAAAKVSTFKPQELALMTWAFAHSKTPDAALFAVLGDEACNQAARFSPQNVANCVWAFTVQKVEHSKLYEALAAEAPKVNLNAAELSCVAWSFAAARVPATALFGAIALQSQDKIKTFQAQDLADVSWAFATAGFEAPVLFQAVANVAVSKMSTFNAKDMATTVWAFAKARVSAPTLFQAVAAEAAKKMESFSADDVASTVFAFGKMRAFHPALLEAAAVEAVSKMQNYSSSGLANLVLGFAKLGFLEPQLFDAVAEVAAGAEFDMEQLTAVVWAFAATAAADSAKARVLFDALAVVVVKKAGELNSHDLSTILCAYATAGIAAPALFDAAGGAVALKMQECGQDLSKKFRREDLSRLHQVAVHLKMEQPQHALARALQDHAESLKAAYVSGDATPVATQKHVSQGLNTLGWAHDFEHLTSDGFSLDMASASARLVVEFDAAPHHVVLGGGKDAEKVLDGSNKFKERILRMLGWTVIRVPYYDWERLQSNADRDAFLRGIRRAIAHEQRAASLGVQKEAFLLEKRHEPYSTGRGGDAAPRCQAQRESVGGDAGGGSEARVVGEVKSVKRPSEPPFEHRAPLRRESDRPRSGADAFRARPRSDADAFRARPRPNFDPRPDPRQDQRPDQRPPRNSFDQRLPSRPRSDGDDSRPRLDDSRPPQRPRFDGFDGRAEGRFPESAPRQGFPDSNRAFAPDGYSSRPDYGRAPPVDLAAELSQAYAAGRAAANADGDKRRRDFDAGDGAKRQRSEGHFYGDGRRGEDTRRGDERRGDDGRRYADQAYADAAPPRPASRGYADQGYDARAEAPRDAGYWRDAADGGGARAPQEGRYDARRGDYDAPRYDAPQRYDAPRSDFGMASRPGARYPDDAPRFGDSRGDDRRPRDYDGAYDGAKRPYDRGPPMGRGPMKNA